MPDERQQDPMSGKNSGIRRRMGRKLRGQQPQPGQGEASNGVATLTEENFDFEQVLAEAQPPEDEVAESAGPPAPTLEERIRALVDSAHEWRATLEQRIVEQRAAEATD